MIDEFIKTLDSPTDVIGYPTRTVYQSDTGHPVYGIDPDATDAAGDRRIIEPLQVVRRPGLGDKIFALAATYAYLQEHPDADVTFSGLDTDTWLKQIPWLKTGINYQCKSVANLDNTPCNGGDRAQLMGRILGVDVTSIEFPITVPKKKFGLKKPYYVFSPWAARHGPRSLPTATVVELLKDSPVRLALTDSTKADYDLGSMVTNMTGLDMFGLIALIAESAGVIGVDTGVPWLALAMGKPALIFGSHVPAKDRTMTCRNVLWVSPPASCAKNCGDHVGTMPQCRFKDKVPACLQHLGPEFTRYQMREFAKL